jgi:hypothetical protein
MPSSVLFARCMIVVSYAEAFSKGIRNSAEKNLFYLNTAMDSFLFKKGTRKLGICLQANQLYTLTTEIF